MSSRSYNITKKGFTLLEILLVIAAIGVLAAIVIVAINPNRQLAQARDAERRSEVNNLHKALEQYLIDTGEYPAGVSTVSQEVCAPGGSVDCIDLSGDLVPTYLAAIPVDPDVSGDGSGYSVSINGLNAKIGVQSLYPELQDMIGINAPNFLLEGYENLVVAYSLRRLRSEYTGPAVRVRRGADNTEQDIGFTPAGVFDSAGLESFLGGGDGYVVTWYDQSGGGFHATATATQTQPRIADSSGQTIELNSQPAILFDPNTNSDERELYATGFSLSQGDLYTVANFRDTILNNINDSDLLHVYDGGNDGYRFIRYNYSTSRYTPVVFIGNTSTFASYVSTDLDQNLYYSRMSDGEQILGINGTNIGQNTYSSLAGLPANRLYIGDDSTQDNAFYGHIQELILFDVNTSANRSTIESAVNGFYEIY